MILYVSMDFIFRKQKRYLRLCQQPIIYVISYIIKLHNYFLFFPTENTLIKNNR